MIVLFSFLLTTNPTHAQSDGRTYYLGPFVPLPAQPPPFRLRLILPPQEPPEAVSPSEPSSQSQNENLKLININCNPALTPSNGGCGISEFVILIKGIIDYLLTIIVPSIAILMFVWAGFVIMTAGGSTAHFEKGKKIIVAALVGVIIALGVWLIIHGIYQILGVKTDGEIPIPQ